MPRPAPSVLIAPVETFTQKRTCRQRQLADHWKQVQNFLATCPATNLVEHQGAYDAYLSASAQFEMDFPPEVLPVNTDPAVDMQGP